MDGDSDDDDHGDDCNSSKIYKAREDIVMKGACLSGVSSDEKEQVTIRWDEEST